MAEVYWIRLPEHTDMSTQGYIGITGRTSRDRFKGHLKESKRKDRKKYMIHNAINKYKDQVILQTLVICDDDYAKDLEYKLRPEPRIGWNTVAGGGKVKLLRDIKEKLTHTEESIELMRRVQSTTWSVNRKERLAAPARLRKALDRPTDQDGNATKFWVGKLFTRPTSNKAYWGFAQELRDMYDDNVNISSVELMTYLGVNLNKRQFFQRILGYFDGGWIPDEDPLWVEDFKEGQDVS